jgi:ElaB/YqjD/DUF883 family membrane-anchored ribosome-binding protein
MARSTTTNSGTPETSIADLTAQIETLRKDLGILTDTITDYGKDKSNELQAMAAERAKHAREKGREASDIVSARASDARHQAERYVTSKPVAALGIAAGIGFLVGLMSTRR